MAEDPNKLSSHPFWIDEPDRLRDPLDQFVAPLDARFCVSGIRPRPAV